MMPTLTKRRAGGENEAAQQFDAMLPITVFADLLPHEIVEGRNEKRSRKQAIIALSVVLVLVLGWDVYSRVQTSRAQSRLDAANAATTSLLAQQHSFGELTTVQADSARITSQLRTLMATDLEWDNLLSLVRHAAPPGLSVAAIQGGYVTETTQPLGTTAKSLGTVTLTGVATDPSLIATLIDTLAKIPGVADAMPSSVSQGGKGGYSFAASFSITKDSLDGKYAATPTPSPKAGK